MDGTVRVWSVATGECVFVLTGHTSLVGLLGLSPSFLVSAAADSTLRIWNLDSGELVHTLAAHTGAITCFVHDEFKVLSGSDGNLKMWDVREGGVVRDLLGGVQGVWQVVCEGRWCVAASNRGDRTVLDVWDFSKVKDNDGEEEEDEENGEADGDGEDGEDGWVGEVVGGVYDDDVFGAEEEGSGELVFPGSSNTGGSNTVGGKSKGKRRVEDDAMDLDGEDRLGEDEEMSSPVQSRGGSASQESTEGLVGGSSDTNTKPGPFRFYGHLRHRRRSGDELDGDGEGDGDGDGDGEGEMQDMRVVEGLVAGGAGPLGAFEFGGGGAWDAGAGASASASARSAVPVSSRRMVVVPPGMAGFGEEGSATMMSVPPLSGQDDTPTRPRGGGGAGASVRGFGTRRK